MIELVPIQTVRVKYQKGIVLGHFRNLGSLRYWNEYFSWPCYELHARLIPSKKSEMRWQAASYIARCPSILAGCIAIGSLATAVDLFVSFTLHEHAGIIAWLKKASVKGFSHTYSTSSHISGNRGYKSNRLRFSSLLKASRFTPGFPFLTHSFLPC